VNRRHLLPLARAALENWASLGPVALTGPIARGDDAVVKLHRAEVKKHAPEFFPLWEALAKATKRVVAEEAARAAANSAKFKLPKFDAPPAGSARSPSKPAKRGSKPKK